MSAKTNTGRSRARQATYAAGGASRTRAHWRDGDPSLATGRAIGSLDQREETRDRHQQYEPETSRDVRNGGAPTASAEAMNVPIHLPEGSDKH